VNHHVLEIQGNQISIYCRQQTKIRTKRLQKPTAHNCHEPPKTEDSQKLVKRFERQTQENGNFQRIKRLSKVALQRHLTWVFLDVAGIWAVDEVVVTVRLRGSLP
jgi:hypothetical protein